LTAISKVRACARSLNVWPKAPVSSSGLCPYAELECGPGPRLASFSRSQIKVWNSFLVRLLALDCHSRWRINHDKSDHRNQSECEQERSGATTLCAGHHVCAGSRLVRLHEAAAAIVLNVHRYGYGLDLELVIGWNINSVGFHPRLASNLANATRASIGMGKLMGLGEGTGCFCRWRYR